ncbi:MAG: hypothetical protein KME16_22220 [Scytolyngbya sp. HA4215-MV1]|jgi:hypothetical protein|nr:hypothetical protein [Scytolyngbya sp. HA4215-MV1]
MQTIHPTAPQTEHSILVSRPRSLTTWFKTLREKITEALFGSYQLQVCQFINGSDIWWYAFDPRTGECVYADSEAELRVWIEQHYAKDSTLDN